MESSRHAKTALVVAHPDDEILWFSSIVDKVDRVLICFMEVPTRQDWTRARRHVAERFPLANAEFLGLTESEAFNGADWSAPVETDFGLEVKRRDNVLPGFNGQMYLENYEGLRRELGSRLVGYSRVFTHNPWGEYGHEEHVQVYRAVRSLKPTLGFEVYFSNYCSSRSYPLMLRHVSGFTSDYETLETNAELARQVEQLYRSAGCWTWPFDDYTWFTHECVMKDADVLAASAAGHVFPLNFIKLNPEPAEGSRGIRRRLRRAIRRPLAAIRGTAG
jgi:LmbE family N-acetylglucosaminyl deacetylase